MADPLQWLREQVAEDRTAALACAEAPWADDVPGMVHVDPAAIRENKWALGRLGFVASADNSPIGDAYRAHIVRHDPRAVLAQCEAHDRIITRHAPRVAAEGPHEGELICGCSTGVDEWHATPWPCDDVRDIMSAYQHRHGYAEAVATLESSTEGTPR